MFKTECAKCSGKGEISCYSAIAGGICFSCNGKGYIETKRPSQAGTKFAVSAVSRESNERGVVFYIKARNEKVALQMAIVRLASGNGFLPETAQVEAA